MPLAADTILDLRRLSRSESRLFSITGFKFKLGAGIGVAGSKYRGLIAILYHSSRLAPLILISMYNVMSHVNALQISILTIYAPICMK